MPSSTPEEREKTIGECERSFNLEKQICTEIARGLVHLNRQMQLADQSQRFKIGQQITAAEIRHSEARERFENAAIQLRQAYSLRGGAIPSIDTRIVIEAEVAVVDDESELVRQFRLETELRKAEEDRILFSQKLAVTTRFALEQVFKKHPEPETAAPVTVSQLAEDQNALETRINRVQSEILYLEEAIRPLKLSRHTATKAAERARIELALADLLPPYEAKLTELAELRNAHKNAMARYHDEAKSFTNAVR